jgi:hypothetical protein
LSTHSQLLLLDEVLLLLLGLGALNLRPACTTTNDSSGSCTSKAENGWDEWDYPRHG